MAKFNKNELYTTKDIARQIIKTCPNHYRTEASCITTVSYIIKKKDIQSVNKQKMFRLFTGIDSEAVYKEITEMIKKGQTIKQLELDLTPILTDDDRKEVEEGFNSEQLQQLEAIIRKAVEEIILPALSK